jgi:hypothetical protein
VLLVGERASILASHHSETRSKTIIMPDGLVRMYLITNCKDKTVATWPTLGEFKEVQETELGHRAILKDANSD